jgi:hypothetical protein
MSEYELVKKLGSYDNFKGLKSMAKVPRHKLFVRKKLSAPTVFSSICDQNQNRAAPAKFRTQKEKFKCIMSSLNLRSKQTGEFERFMSLSIRT